MEPETTAVGSFATILNSISIMIVVANVVWAHIRINRLQQRPGPI